MTRDQILEHLRKAAASVLGADPETVVETARFGEELDADSLDMIELVMALEDELDVPLPEEELEGIETVGDAIDLIASKLPAPA